MLAVQLEGHCGSLLDRCAGVNWGVGSKHVRTCRDFRLDF